MVRNMCQNQNVKFDRLALGKTIFPKRRGGDSVQLQGGRYGKFIFFSGTTKTLTFYLEISVS